MTNYIADIKYKTESREFKLNLIVTNSFGFHDYF